MTKKNVLFFVRHFLERGTEVSVYQYAHYNETILGNESYIVCFTKDHPMRKNHTEATVYNKFKNRFTIFELNTIEDITNYIDSYNISVFYTQTHGGEDVYKFDNRSIWKSCKTIKHCVFNTNTPESDFYCSISEYLTKKDGTNIPALPYMVDLPETQDNMRTLLHIPENAIVFGGYGGKEQFNIEYVQKIVEHVASNSNSLETPIYFLFANFNKFCPDSPRIIHLPMILNPMEKVKFINTCDAMLWARSDGETFGLAIGEFSSKNKPIICTAVGDLAHVEFLREKGLWYNSAESLLNILLQFSKDSVKGKDWNCYREYTPEKVMGLFNNILEKLLRNKV